MLNEVWAIELNQVDFVTKRLESAQAAQDRGATLPKAKSVGLQVDSGIAIIDVNGPLSRRTDWLSQWLGWSDYATIESQIDHANASDSVLEIVLRCDSPGGVAAGASQLADVVGSSKKPITAIVDGLCASACYLVASRAKKIVASADSLVGSIGTVMTLAEYSRQLDTNGVTVNEIVSAPLKTAGSPYREMTDADRAALQSLVDGFNDLFKSQVLQGRKWMINMAKVSTGQVWLAEEARALGLIDEIGRFAIAVDTLKQRNAVKFNQASAALVKDREAEAYRQSVARAMACSAR